MAKERVFDEIISFLGDVTFQVPVRTFMDENCIIFDPSIALAEDHKKVHGQYKHLVDTLLEGFCQDNKISMDQAIKGVKSMSEIPDLREVFQGIFEQVLGAVDFDVFVNVMCKRNIEIQQQALLLMISLTGHIPESLMQDDSQNKPKASSKPKQNEAMVSANQEDEDILKKVMMESQRDEEVRKMKVTQEEKELQKTLAMSQLETERLDREKQALEKDMQKLSVSEKFPLPSTSTTPKPAPVAAAARPVPRQPVMAVHPKSDVTNSSAASDWLRSAQQEASKSTTHAAVVAEMSKLSPEELRKRQDYLKEQRDKLLSMKKQQREKQLTVAEKTTNRPSSARAARKAMATQQPAPPSEEDEKKMAMRRAIADKLKLEVIGK